MPEIDLRQPEFAYGACRRYTKNKEWIQNLKEGKNSRHIFHTIY